MSAAHIDPLPDFTTWTTTDLVHMVGAFTRTMARGIVTETGAAQAYAMRRVLAARGVDSRLLADLRVI